MRAQGVARSGLLPALLQPVQTVYAAWPFIRLEGSVLGQVALVTIGLTAVEVAIPLLTRIFVDLITGGHTWSTLVGPFSPLGVLALLFLIAVARGILLTQQRGLAGGVGERTAARFRTRLWAHLQEIPASRTASRGPGRLLVRFISDIRAVQRLTSDGFVIGSQNVLLIVAALVVLTLLNWRMALPVLLLVPVYAILFWLLNPRIRQISRGARRRLGSFSNYMHQRIVGIKLVKANVRQASERQHVQRLTTDLARRGTRLAETAGALEGLAAATVGCAIALALAVAMEEVQAGRATTGTIVAYVMLLGQLAPVLRRVARLNRTLQLAQVSMDRLNATLSEPVEAPALVKPRTLRVRSGTLILREVSLARPDGSPILDKVSLRARRGQIVALIGPNGAGKSSLFDLILRFQKPSSGKVVIDRRDLANVTVDSLRGQIGWVPQEALLFDGTLADNVAYGAPKRVSRAAIERACTLAGVDSFARRLPRGLDSRLSGGAQTLSHGQRQRVALARALVADPPILLLDEVFAGVDPETEVGLVQMLRDLAPEKTILIATHRLPALLVADKIYVLRRGRLVEHGTHKRLLSRGRYYPRIVRGEPLLSGKKASSRKTTSSRSTSSARRRQTV